MTEISGQLCNSRNFGTAGTPELAENNSHN